MACLPGVIRKQHGPSRKGGPTQGFTLIEVLLSVAILSIAAAAVTEAFSSGHRTVQARVERGQIDSAMRSCLEVLLASNFDQLASGSQNVTINGQSCTMTWTVSSIDLNGDAVPEPDARQITVSLQGCSLSTIVTSHMGAARPKKIA